MHGNESKEKKYVLFRKVAKILLEREEQLSDKEMVRVLEEVLAILENSGQEQKTLKPQQIIPPMSQWEHEDACGKTEVFDVEHEWRTREYPETTILNVPIRLPFLIRQSTKEKILINRDVFKLGKERNYVDYYIDNDAVSRSHADIIRQRDDFFVIDHNSLNHTYLEGSQIPARQYVRLESGQDILLGNEAFTFYYETI